MTSRTEPLTADKLAAVRTRQRALAASGNAPEAAADLDMLLAEINRLADEAKAARDDVDRVARERDAYQRAKAENDERFLLERDHARQEAERAHAVIEAARLTAAAWNLSDEEITARLVGVGGVARVEQWTKLAAGRGFAGQIAAVLNADA